jgi:putative endonuclease
MYYVYILESIPTGRFYVGSTQDIENRLRKHNAGHSAATKGYRPWRLLHVEEFASRGDALRREYEIKRFKSREYIASLLDENACPVTTGREESRPA